MARWARKVLLDAVEFDPCAHRPIDRRPTRDAKRIAELEGMFYRLLKKIERGLIAPSMSRIKRR